MMPCRKEWLFLLAVIGVGCLVQWVAISRAVVPALDAVRFARAAQSIDEVSLVRFLQETPEPPVFAVCVWVVHGLLVSIFGAFADAWAISVQLAAALPLVLLPIPVYFTARRFVGERPAMLGTVVVASLPELVRLGADGISDSTHLFWFSCALWMAVSALAGDDRRSLGRLAALAAGVAMALALLTRSEAALLAVAFAGVLSVRWMRQWRSAVRPAIEYGAGLAAILVPYGALLLVPCEASSEPIRGVAVSLETAQGEALSFASKDPTMSIRNRGFAAAVWQIVDEAGEAFGYLAGVLAIVGLWILRRHTPTEADRLLQCFCLLLLAAVLSHTVREGYLAARHLLPMVIAATACIGAGVSATAEWLRRLVLCRILEDGLGVMPTQAWACLAAQPTCPRERGHGTGWATALAVGLAVVWLAYGLKPLHDSRQGHRAAAEWLVENAAATDRVVDTRGWTGLYSGLPTTPYKEAAGELHSSDIRYFVVEDAELTHDSRRGRTLTLLLATAADRVATFSPTDGSSRRAADVSVYHWDAGQLALR